jgi:hypothetical protein
MTSATATLNDVIFTGLGTGGLILACWWIARTLTLWTESRKPLTPNCLITRKPLVLISSQSPSWTFWSEDRKALRYLRNHGFETWLWHLEESRSSEFFQQRIASGKSHLFVSAQIVDIWNLLKINNEALILSFSDGPRLLEAAVRRAEEDFI